MVDLPHLKEEIKELHSPK